MFCDCKILQKEPTFNFSQVVENDKGPALFSLPKEMLARIGILVVTGLTEKKDALSWSSVSVLTHHSFHQVILPKILEAKALDDALKKLWSKMPSWCGFPEHIEHDGYGGSWGGNRPQTVEMMRLWFEDLRTNIQMQQITELYLAKLALTLLPPEVEQFSQLSYIDLSHNRLSCIPLVLSKCPQLSRVILDHNRITEVPDWLGEHPQLFWVQLLDNPVSEKDRASLTEKLRKIVVLK